jgi:anti-sigma-K factor RskA
MEDDILIDNYLKGSLTENEQKSFLARLESDYDFNELFELEKQLVDTLDEGNWSFIESENPEVKEYAEMLEDSDFQNLKKTLSHTNSEFNSDMQNGTRKLFYYLAAASVVLFLGFQFFFNQTPSHTELYNEYVALNDLPSLVSRSDDNSDLIKAQVLFETSNYQEALDLFQTSSPSQNSGTILIYKGLSQSQLNKNEEAIVTFNSLVRSDLIDAQKGNWYTALLFVKLNRVEEAKELLNKIISESLYNHEIAVQLLRDL